MGENEELISSYIDQPAITGQTDFFLGEIKRLDDAYNNLSNKSISLGGLSSSKEITAQIKDLQAEIARLQKTKEELLTTDLKSQKVATEAAKTKEAEAKAALANSKAVEAEAKAKAESNKQGNADQAKKLAEDKKAEAKARKDNADAAKAEQKAAADLARQQAIDKKITEDLSNDYKQLSLAYADAAARAKQLQLAQGNNSPAAKAAIAEANALGSKLKEVDASVGQYQRNVGNYANSFVEGFSKAFGFLRVAANIIPGLGLSGIFLLAFEAISSVVQSLGFFSNALEKAAEDQQFLNEVTSKAIDLQKEYEEVTQRNYGTQNRGAQNELLYAKARGDSAEKILGFEKKIAQLRAETASNDFFATGGENELDKIRVKLSAAEEALTSFYRAGKSPGLKPSIIPGLSAPTFDQERYNKSETQLKAEFEVAKKEFDKQRGITEEFYNANRDLAAKDLEIKKLNGEKLKNYYSKQSNELAQYYIGLEDALSKAVNIGVQDRIYARTREFEETKAIDTKAYNEKLRDARETLNEALNKTGGSDKDKANAVRKYNADVATINDEFRTGQKVDELRFQDDIATIRHTAAQKQKDDDKKNNDDALAQFKAQHDARLALLTDKNDTSQNLLKAERDRQLAALDSRREVDLRDKNQQKQEDDDYNHEKLRIEAEYLRSSLLQNIRYIETLLEIRKQITATNPADQIQKDKEIASFEAQIAALKAQLAAAQTGQRADRQKDADEDLAKLVSTFQKIQEISGKVTDLIGGAINASIIARKNALQDQSDLIDLNAKKEIDAINASADAASVKADKIALINAKQKADQDEIARKQRQLDQQKAAFDKAANIAGIITSTALAVAKALPNIPLAVLVGAFGAAQLAVAIATPIPKYKHGIYNKDKHPGGKAVVGDGGRPEYVLLPNGEGFVTPSKDTIVDLPRGTQVFPDAYNLPEDIFRMAFKPVRQMKQLPANDNGSALLAKKIDILTQVVRNKPVLHQSASKKGLQSLWVYGQSWTNYIDQQTNF